MIQNTYLSISLRNGMNAYILEFQLFIFRGQYIKEPSQTALTSPVLFFVCGFCWFGSTKLYAGKAMLKFELSFPSNCCTVAEILMGHFLSEMKYIVAMESQGLLGRFVVCLWLGS